MNIKHLLTISLAVFLSACNHPNNSVPIQDSDSSYSDEYQNAPLTNTEALAIGATGVATGYALGKYANKPNNSYGKPVVVFNKHHFDSGGNNTRTKYKSTFRKRK